MDNLIKISGGDYKKVLRESLHTRDHYLDSHKVSQTDAIVGNKDKILFLMNDVKEPPPFKPYTLIAHGITPCGTKCTVLITNINPHVDVELDPNVSETDNVNTIKSLLKDSKLKEKLKCYPDVESIKLVYGRKLIGFSEKDSTFLRIYFKILRHRNEFINMLDSMGIDTFNNDLSSYYRVVARENKLALAGWNWISNYSKVGSGEYLGKYTFEVDILNVCRYDSQDVIEPWETNDIRLDKTISMCWDIEQYSSDFDVNQPNKPTRIPSGLERDDTIFNIGMTFQLINDKESFLNLSLICKEAKPHDDYITVECDSEKTLILAWAYINSLMQPDFIVEFNGSGFDWPNMVNKCYVVHHILPEFIDMLSLRKLNTWERNPDKLRKFSYCVDNIKISADRTVKIANLRLHGYIAIDLRVVLMRENATESKSPLKFYLDMYGLPSKDDMPIPVLFNHFITGDVDGLGDVAHYCYIDCFRLHQLLNKVNIIPDKRAVGLLSYSSVFDTFYRANGSKVRNRIVANAVDLNLFYNSIPKKVREEDKEEGKYPGALVLKPRRGLVNPMLSFKEFCKHKLDVYDPDIITTGQQVVAANFDAFFKGIEINSKEDVERILKAMGI